jgi:CDP-diacylglycerol--glycerol-3-phosphate 3-phosphatidyltransferase
MAGLMMVLLTLDHTFAKSAALLVFAVAGFTDYLDGYLARKHNLITAFGRLMDPLTDKVMVCAAFVGFVEIQLSMPEGHTVSLVPAWITVTIISREFLVTGLRMLAASRGNIIAAGKWGKHKTVWQIVAIVVLLLGVAVREDLLRHAGAKLLADYDFSFYYIARGISVAVALITVGSGLMYFIQHRELIADGR